MDENSDGGAGDGGGCGGAAGGSATAGLAADLAQLDQLLTRLLDRDLTALDRDALLAAGPALHRQLTRLTHAQTLAWAETQHRGLPAELTLRGLPDLIAATTRCGTPAARRAAHAAARFAPRRAFTGQTLPPLHPACAAGLADGSVSPAHAAVVADHLAALPATVPADLAAAAETALAAHARDLDPAALRALATRIAAHLDPDGPQPEDDAPHRCRSLAFAPPNPDGLIPLTALLAPDTHALWQTALAHAPTTNPAGGLPDTRTAAQRHHDAFHELGLRLLAAGDLPDHAGLPATVLIAMTLTDLETRAGQATTHTGGALTIPQALRLAADAKLIPIVLADDKPGEVLFHGHGKRLAQPPQRRCLYLRDRGCSFPGCPRPAAHCEIHHAPDWANGGRTDLDTMTITCGYHNREAPRQGWETLMINGIPHWKPPPWIDPQRTPRRNYTHHPELLLPQERPPPDGRARDD